MSVGKILSLFLVCGFANLHATELSLLLVNDTSKVVSGGLDRATSIRTLGVASVEFRVSDKWTVYSDAQLLRGDDGAEDVGNIQAYSNIDEAEFSRVYELWVERRFGKNDARIKLGKVDANAEFAYVEHAGEFIHSSMGFSPTIAFLPTYPSPAIAANAFVNFAGNGLGLGVYSDEDKQFDEQFYIAEWQRKFSGTTIKTGVWHQTGKLEKLTVDDELGATENGTSGVYIAAEGALLSSQQSGWFLQAGWADADIAAMDTHLGVGLVWYGPMGRDDDVAGLGVTHVTVSKFLGDTFKRKETAIEGFYRYQFTKTIVVKPDIQYIVNPAADIAIKNALVFTLRTEISL